MTNPFTILGNVVAVIARFVKNVPDAARRKGLDEPIAELESEKVAREAAEARLARQRRDG